MKMKVSNYYSFYDIGIQLYSIVSDCFFNRTVIACAEKTSLRDNDKIPIIIDWIKVASPNKQRTHIFFTRPSYHLNGVSSLTLVCQNPMYTF